jgi:hypothetical protein
VEAFKLGVVLYERNIIVKGKKRHTEEEGKVSGKTATGIITREGGTGITARLE